MSAPRIPPGILGALLAAGISPAHNPAIFSHHRPRTDADAKVEAERRRRRREQKLARRRNRRLK